MGYLTFPFVLLEFNASVRLYLRVFMCLHVIGLITIYVLPRFIRGESRSQQTQQSSVPVETETTVTTEKRQHNVIQKMVDKIGSSDDAKKWELNNGPMTIVADADDNTTNRCDIRINGKCDDDIGTEHTNASTDSISSDVANHTHNNNQPLHSLSETNRVNNNSRTDKNNHLSQKIRVRIDNETKNIEGFIDKTVTGIVELKEDLMRVSGDELYATDPDGLRKRASNASNVNGCAENKDVDLFLRKEINMNQVNVLPAVLSNGHGD